MDIKQLNYFVHVADLSSISKAAAVLGMAQPALSRQIRGLETDLGANLFYRNGRGVSVTEAGERLLGYAKSMVDQADRIRNEITMLRDHPSGAVRLGVPPTVGQVLVPSLIRQIRDDHPDIALKVTEGFSGFVHEWLVGGRLDLAVLYDARRSSRLITDPLVTEHMFLIGPPTGSNGPGDPIPFGEIADLPLILPSRPHGLRILIDTVAARVHMPLKIEYEVESASATLELVESGVSYTIQPYASVYRRVEAGQLSARRIIEPLVTRTLVLATSTQKPLSLATRAVLDNIKQEVKSLVNSGKWLGTA